MRSGPYIRVPLDGVFLAKTGRTLEGAGEEPEPAPVGADQAAR